MKQIRKTKWRWWAGERLGFMFTRTLLHSSLSHLKPTVTFVSWQGIYFPFFNYYVLMSPLSWMNCSLSFLPSPSTPWYTWDILSGKISQVGLYARDLTVQHPSSHERKGSYCLECVKMGVRWGLSVAGIVLRAWICNHSCQGKQALSHGIPWFSRGNELSLQAAKLKWAPYSTCGSEHQAIIPLSCLKTKTALPSENLWPFPANIN